MSDPTFKLTQNQLLRKAANVYSTRKHCKGHWGKSDTGRNLHPWDDPNKFLTAKSCCMEGAVYLAAFEAHQDQLDYPLTGSVPPWLERPIREAIEACLDHIGELEGVIATEDGIPDFNDNPDTTLEQVLQLFQITYCDNPTLQEDTEDETA